MKIKRRILLFITAIITLAVLFCVSGCSSITVGGKKLKRPNEICFPRVGLYSPSFCITSRKEIEKVMSFFDQAEFILSDEELTEADGNVTREESVIMCFGEDNYCISVAENGRAQCSVGNENGEKHYISAVGAVDYAGLRVYADNEIQKYFDSIK